MNRARMNVVNRCRVSVIVHFVCCVGITHVIAHHIRTMCDNIRSIESHLNVRCLLTVIRTESEFVFNIFFMMKIDINVHLCQEDTECII